MSYKSYLEAVEQAKKCKGYSAGIGKTAAVIDNAETVLGFKFSRQFREYLQAFGYIEFYGTEIYGIVKDDFSGAPAGNCVEAALADRADYNLPKLWLPIYDYGDGHMAYLDYGNCDSVGEPPAIAAEYRDGKYVEIEQAAEDFGGFVFALVQEQLARQ